MSQTTRQGAETEGVLFGGFSKPVRVEFTAEQRSDFGGVPLLAAVDRRLGLTEALARTVEDPRQAGKVSHPMVDLLRQRIYGIALGLPDVRDAARLRDDPAMRLVLDRDLADEGEALASAPVLSRLENRVRRGDLLRLGQALAECVIAKQALRRKGRAPRITIDMDPSDDPTYGQQQLSFFNGHYENWCYLPAFAFVTFHGVRDREEKEQHLVAALLRPGNAGAALGARYVLTHVTALLQRHFPGARIRVRLDGGYASGEMFDLLETMGVEYVVNMGKNARLVEVTEPLMARARASSAASGGSERVYGETRYAAQEWRRERRVVIKAQVVRDPARPDREPKDNPRFVVTNLKASPQHVYEVVYCHRGEVENRIKELKDDLRSDLTSCTSFLANQFRLLLSAAAYVLLQDLRGHARDEVLSRARAVTLRERLLLLGARVVASTRRFVVQLSRTALYRQEWIALAKSVGASLG